MARSISSPLSIEMTTQIPFGAGHQMNLSVVDRKLLIPPFEGKTHTKMIEKIMSEIFKEFDPNRTGRATSKDSLIKHVTQIARRGRAHDMNR